MKTTADILFVHNNFPGQYKLLAKHLSQSAGVRVFAIGSHTATEMAGVELQRYQVATNWSQSIHSFANRFDLECRRAEQVIYAANILKLNGMSPKLIFVHPGWGEALPLRQMFPDAKICVYCEFYYQPQGADVGFDTESQGYGIDGLTRIHLRNAATLLALVDADIGIAPTKWQQSTFPPEFKPKIRVLHDGIDTAMLSPGPSCFSHPAIRQPLRTGDEVLTFIARNLEPYRGFRVFMRALPRILAARPNVQVCIVGGTSVSYGGAPPAGDSWKDVMLNEVGAQLDMTRLHFLDRIPYEQFVGLLRVSRVHAYLTYPFVLSWSLLEALALECIVVASDTPPVQEIITDKHNGFLVPFFEIDALTAKIVKTLGSPERFASVKEQARATIQEHYCFERKILPQFLKLISELVPDVVDVAKHHRTKRRQPIGHPQSSKINV
jgi:glycosyltransferase involved in cell wall biosynthesis